MLSEDCKKDPDKILEHRILLFRKNYVEILGASTRQRLAARLAKHITIQQSIGGNIIPKTLKGYLEVYIDFLELDVEEYLQRN